jgi:radical SAM superfamily enzyme YgiQ (UPF0313 family)
MSGPLKVLAIYPEYQEQKVFDPMPPLGLAWIAGTIREHGYEVRIVDEQVETVNAGDLVRDMRPALVLLGGTSHSRFHAFERAAAIKAADPEATVVYGGPHASFTAEDTLRHVPSIDIVVSGEGEHATLELLQWKESGGDWRALEKIDGITYRMDGGIVATRRRTFNQALDTLPLPARDLLQIDKYHMTLEYLGLPALHIMTARGCPFRCSFCSASQMYGHCYAMRSATRVVDEIESLVARYGIRGVKIFDSTFTINHRHVHAFCEELERRDLVMPWECEVRVGSVDRPLLERMQKAGCYYVDIGIESADQEVLDTMRKQIRPSRAEELLRWCHELGLRTKVFFTIGHIGETYATGLKTIRFIRRNRKHITLIGYGPAIRIYPGTEVEQYALEHHLLPAGFRWSAPYVNTDNLRIYLAANNVPVLLQPNMGIDELRRLRHRYILSRVTSPSFLVSKLKRLVRYGELAKYIRLGFKGVLGKPPRAA